MAENVSFSKMSFAALFCLFFGHSFACMEQLKEVTFAENLGIGFVILSQPNYFHNSLADLKKNEILEQVKELHLPISIKVLKSHKDFGHVIGHWTVIPLFEKLLKYSGLDWIFFLEERSKIELKKLLKIMSMYNSSEDVFAGYALKDSEPTIIHHFAACDEDSALLYPRFSTGFLMSFSLIKKLIKRCEDCQFSIDPQYELAKFIWKNAGVKLTHACQLQNVTHEDLDVQAHRKMHKCGPVISTEKVYVAVKTCKKFHKDRVKVLKHTWAPSVEKLDIFSDSSDPTIPTIKVDVKNVESGHCEKTMSIMKYYVSHNISFEWLIIVDDDTLISFKRLMYLLSCYNSSEYVSLGERYGFGVVANYGYDYLTGGSGMVFSLPVVQKLVASCLCPSIDSPDDMIIGLCLKNMNIPVTHSPYFHQARPIDYTEDFLLNLKHVSFHKHWMIDPYEMYEKWLKEEPTPLQHSEL